MDSIKVITAVLVSVAISVAAMTALQPKPQVNLGALTGPDIPSNYLKWGGVAVYKARMALNTATTTPCAIQSPAATSTLMSTDLTVTTATSTATTWTAATAATAYATTSPIVPNWTLSSGAFGTMTAATSSAVSTVDANNILAPNTWVVWSVAGVVPADTSKLNGYCQAEFRSIGA